MRGATCAAAALSRWSSRLGAAERCQGPSRVPGLRGGEPSRCSRSSCRLGGCRPPPTRSESSATARNHQGHWHARVDGSSLRLTPQPHRPISSPPLTLLLASSPCDGANRPWRTPGTPSLAMPSPRPRGFAPERRSPSSTSNILRAFGSNSLLRNTCGARRSGSETPGAPGP
jgi:hypothetical protein